MTCDDYDHGKMWRMVFDNDIVILCSVILNRVLSLISELLIMGSNGQSQATLAL